jgi:hypothetical protein
MNRKMSFKLKGKRVRLRPIPRRLDLAGNELEQSDHSWFVKDVNSDGLTVQNAGFGHLLTLAPDQIHDYRTDPSGESFGFLVLHGRVWVKGREAGVEPLTYQKSLTVPVYLNRILYQDRRKRNR